MINQSSLETIETNQRSGFRVLGVGGVAFVQPYGATLTADQLAVLQGAAAVAQLGRRRVAEAICAHVQRELGVSQELHQLGLAAAAAKLAHAQRTARTSNENQIRLRATALGRSFVEPPASKEVRRALRFADEARQGLRQARLVAKAAREAVEAVRKRGDVPSEALRLAADQTRTASWVAVGVMRVRSAAAAALRSAQLDEAWAAHAAGETAGLAQARGEELGRVKVRAIAVDKGKVQIEPAWKGNGPLRISSRDGLATLYESEKITSHQYGAGRAYRTAYELAAAGLKIANLNPSGGGGRVQHGTLASHRSAQELQKSYVLARLRQIEIAVGGLGPRELRVLRAVAGEGHTIRSLGGSGNAREADTRALVRALEAVVAVLAGPIQRRLKREAAA